MGTSNYNANQPGARFNTKKLAPVQSQIGVELDENGIPVPPSTTSRSVEATELTVPDKELVIQESTGSNSKLVEAQGNINGAEDGPPGAPTTSEAETTQKIFPNLRIEPNILSVYESPTYNFRFFLARENAEHATIQNEDIIVIAESGSTGFSITDVNISSTTGPSSFGRNAVFDKITFKIIEPHGNRLFDQIRNSALNLNIYDHRKTPYWLSLTFKGYSPSGSDSYTGGVPTRFNNAASNVTSELNDPNLDNINFLWKMTITDVQTEIVSGGTEYKFTATPYAQTGLRDDARRIEKDESIEATTLGDFFDKLADRLNRYENYNLNSSEDITKRIRQYAFGIPDEFKNMRKWVINNPADNKSQSIRNSQPFGIKIEDTEKGMTKRITFSKGTPIEAIIQEVVGSTLEGQSLAIFGETGRDTADAGSETRYRNHTKPSVVFIADPIVDVLSYNGVSRSYNVLVTYHIRPYRTFKPVVSRTQIENYERNSNQRLRAMIDKLALRKRYDYIFTGLNTEVLDYKIQFNHAWFVPLPIFQGQNKSGTATSSRRMSKDKAKIQTNQTPRKKPDSRTEQSIEKKAVKDLTRNELVNELTRLEKLDALLNEEGDQLSLANAQRQQQIIRLLRNQQELATGDGGVSTLAFGSNSYIRLENDFTTTTTTPIRTNDKTGASDTPIIIGAENARRQVAEARNTFSRNTGSIFFAEDFERRSVGTRSSIDLTENQKSEIVQVSTELGPTNPAFLGNIETTSSKGRSYFSAIMNQVYGNMSDMVELDLTIRGDPYWLGEPDPRARVFRTGIEAGNSRDLTNGDTYILMSFDFPTRFDDGGPNRNIFSHEGSGLVDLENHDNAFNGIYYVTTIEHEFSNGKFTQRIKGNIDPITKEQDVIALLNASNR